MEKNDQPIPELEKYLTEERFKTEIEKVCKNCGHSTVWEYVNESVRKFEKDLNSWYIRKAIREHPKISEEKKKLSSDMEDLGF